MANTGISYVLTKLAATSSWVDNGFEAHRVTTAPPALRVLIKLAVSAVTCKQAPILIPFNGFLLKNSSFICESTGMKLSAHSILSFPFSESSMSFTSYSINLPL
ncbi:hypothetical protein ES703_109950 [subsurface metagenome]